MLVWDDLEGTPSVLKMAGVGSSRDTRSAYESVFREPHQPEGQRAVRLSAEQAVGRDDRRLQGDMRTCRGRGRDQLRPVAIVRGLRHAGRRKGFA